MAKQWLDLSEYPFRSNYMEIGGHRLHYLDEGRGDTLLFVHGTPSWSFDFRQVIKDLRDAYRCVAIDHIGFGLSEKPEHYDYSTLNHSRTLERFVLEKGLDNLTLVLHDFGGPIGFHFALRHPDKIRNLVMLNSWLWSSQADPEFIRLSRLLKSPLLPFLYRHFNFSPRVVLPRSFGDRKLSKRLLRHYVRPFADKGQRNGTMAFARSLLTDQEWFEALWRQRETLSSKPVLFIWGVKDPVVKPGYLDKFLLGFPGAKVVRLKTCGHFPQEEEPAAVAASIRGFLSIGPPTGQ